MRQIYFTLCSISLLLMLPACDQNGGALPIDAKAFLSKLDGPKIPTMQESQDEAAKAAEKKGDFAQAVQIYQQMLEKNENDSDTILALADALRRNGEYEKATSAYDNLIKKDPNNLAAREGKGLVMLSKGDFETPTSIFLDVLKIDGKRWKSLNAVGILFTTRGLYPESQRYFEESLHQNPRNVSVMNNLGLAQALNKQFSASVATLQNASAQSSVEGLDRKRIDLNLAMVYASMGKLDEAEKIARLHLTGVQLSNNLGLYAHLAKDDQLAKSYLNMALTDSTVYYSKAWDNLEAINSSKSNKTKQLGDATASKKEKPAKDSKQRPALNKEPTAASSPVQSLGRIKSDNLD